MRSYRHANEFCQETFWQGGEPVVNIFAGKKFVIRFRIKERLADRQFATGRNVTLTELAEAIGVTRGTVSKMANQYNYNATIEIVDRLCRYFDCSVEQILEYIPDDKARRSGAGSSDGR